VVNAGGMLSASRDILHEFDEAQLLARIRGIYDTTMEIFELAKAERRPTHEIADHIARRRIAAGRTQPVNLVAYT
jgi:leucine dehydrogenase